MGFRPFLAAIRQQTLCLGPVFTAHLRPEQLQGVAGQRLMLPLGNRSIEMGHQKVGALVTRGADRSANEPRLWRRDDGAGLETAGCTRLGVTRLGIESPAGRSLGPPSSGISKDGSYGM
jgi:hypothetical protein